MDDAKPSLVLCDQAFELVVARHDATQAHKIETLNAKITRFKNQSSAHLVALKQAEHEWGLLGEITPSALTPMQQCRLLLENKAASVGDSPIQWVSISLLCVLALLMPLFASIERGAMPLADSFKASADVTHYATAYGQTNEVHLSDGSIVSLNWNTQISVSYSDKLRQVMLTKGEAIFSVAKNVNRPFIVKVGGVQARAVGTEFSVQKRPHHQADIAVTEGIVEVSIASHRQVDHSHESLRPVLLQANQTVAVTPQKIGQVQHYSGLEISAWRSGMIVFEQRPLSEVLAELNRYTRYNIKADNLQAGVEEVTATYFIDQADEALNSLVHLFDLQLEPHDSGRVSSVLLRDRSAIR